MKRSSLSDNLIETARSLGFSRTTIDQLELLDIPKPKELGSKEVISIRRKINVSQEVFAKILNVSPSTVRKWEQGSAKPKTSALRLLGIIEANGIAVLQP